MEMPTTTHLMILSTLSIVLIFRSSVVMAASPLMEDICHETASTYPNTVTFNDFINALNGDAGSAYMSRAKGLAGISCNLGIISELESENFIRTLISKENDPSVIKSLNSCLSWYEAARNSFGSAYRVILEDPVRARNDVKAAGDNADQCAQELSKLKNNIPSLTARTNNLKLYSAIGVVITNRLH